MICSRPYLSVLSKSVRHWVPVYSSVDIDIENFVETSSIVHWNVCEAVNRFSKSRDFRVERSVESAS